MYCYVKLWICLDHFQDWVSEQRGNRQAEERFSSIFSVANPPRWVKGVQRHLVRVSFSPLPLPPSPCPALPPPDFMDGGEDDGEEVVPLMSASAIIMPLSPVTAQMPKEQRLSRSWEKMRKVLCLMSHAIRRLQKKSQSQKRWKTLLSQRDYSSDLMIMSWCPCSWGTPSGNGRPGWFQVIGRCCRLQVPMHATGFYKQDLNFFARAPSLPGCPKSSSQRDFPATCSAWSGIMQRTCQKSIIRWQSCWWAKWPSKKHINYDEQRTKLSVSLAMEKATDALVWPQGWPHNWAERSLVPGTFLHQEWNEDFSS